MDTSIIMIIIIKCMIIWMCPCRKGTVLQSVIPWYRVIENEPNKEVNPFEHQEKEEIDAMHGLI
jgi:hypothetical protein